MKFDKLLSRDAFRDSTFSRDHHKCIICGHPAQDAHHIIERRLFPDGGYYLDNGASLCQIHHIEAELTTLSCSEVRHAANIQQILLPPHFQTQLNYDKWGNPILADGQRARGQLYDAEPVQKTIAQAQLQAIFTKYTHHPNLDFNPDFAPNTPVVAFQLPDGHFLAIYDDAAYTNDFQSVMLPTNLQKIQTLLDPNLQLFGWLASKTFYPLEIWQDTESLAWPETLGYAQMLDLPVLPLLYQGDFQPLRPQWARTIEGYDLANYRHHATHIQ